MTVVYIHYYSNTEWVFSDFLQKKIFENFNPRGPRVENFEKLMSYS